MPFETPQDTPLQDPSPQSASAQQSEPAQHSSQKETNPEDKEASETNEAFTEESYEDLNKGALPLTDPQTGAIGDIPMTVSVVLGSVKMTVAEILKLGKGDIIPLDKRVGEPLELRINDMPIARGHVNLIDDKLGLTITHILKSSLS